MKVRDKLIPKDEISLDHKTRHVHIFTHRDQIKFMAFRDPHGEGWEFDVSFDELYNLIKERGT